MFFNYLKIGFRNLLKYKSFSIINILGLAISLASAIFIFLWVHHERSFDQFHQNSESFYRVFCQVEDLNAAISPAPMGAALKEAYPEVIDAFRVSRKNSRLVAFDNKKYDEKEVFAVDSNFLENLSFDLIVGDPGSALNAPDKIVISQAAAKKYFGTKDPMGKTLLIENEDLMVVSGVLESPPSNSHLQFDFLLPMSYLAKFDRDIRENTWDNFDYYTYFQVADGTDLTKLEAGMQSIFIAHDDEIKVDFKLQALNDIHLHSNFLGDVEGHGNSQHVLIFTLIGLFILLAAAINFTNLATARASKRTREIGFRKTAGARRSQIIGQFLVESCVITFISLVLALSFVLIFQQPFNVLTGKDLSIRLFAGEYLLYLFGLTMVLGVVAGFYPAVQLSGFRPVQAFASASHQQGGSPFFRNILVVSQFVISIFLLIGTTIIFQQRQFIRNLDLGFNQENLIYFPLKGDLPDKIDQFRGLLAGNALTEKFTVVDDLPVDLVSGTIALDWEGKDPDEQILFAQMDGDHHFIDVLGMELRSGSPFIESQNTQQRQYLLNEKAIDLMGWHPDSAVGKPFSLWQQQGLIKGVVKDFHFKSVLQSIEPLVIRYNQNVNLVIVKVAANQFENTIAALEKLYGQLNPNHPFEYGFVDEELDKQYTAESRLSALTNIFCALAIFISMLGLYGLSAFLAERRRKELGVRKVVGASFWHLVYRLNFDFTKPIWIAMVVAVPLAYFFLSKWLERFAYHVEIGYHVLLLSCLAALVVAILTVSIEASRAALANPIQALQND